MITKALESFLARHGGVKVQQDKTAGQDMAADMTKVTYYLRGTVMSGNVLRVKGHEYSYLDRKTGEWVPHESVVDSVTGYGGDADTFEIPLERAQTLASIFAPNVEVEWLPDGD